MYAHRCLRSSLMIFSLSILVLINLSACSALKKIVPLFSSTDSTHWTSVTDQEVTHSISHDQNAYFVVTKESQVLIYPRDHSPVIELPMADSDLELTTIWAEKISPSEKITVHSIDKVNHPSNSNVQMSSLEEHASSNPKNEPIKDSNNEREEKTSEELELDIEIENEEGKKEADLDIEIEGEEESKEADDLEIDIDESELKNEKFSSSSPKVMKPPAIEHRYIVYVASRNGISAREVQVDRYWRLINPQATWETIYSGDISYIIPRDAGGAWWGGATGVGTLQGAKVKVIDAQLRVKLMSKGLNSAYIINFTDELIKINDQGSDLIDGACIGPTLAMSARRDRDQLILFCGGEKGNVLIRDQAKWRRFEGPTSTPKFSQVRPYLDGWIYRARGGWQFLIESSHASQTQERKEIEEAVSLAKTYDLKEMDQPTQKMIRYELSDQLSFSSWEVDQGDLITATPYQGLRRWINPSTALSAESPFKASDHYRAHTLSANAEYRPFILNAKDELITMTRDGALIGDGKTWRRIRPPEGSGTPLGLVNCKGELLWVTSHRRPPQVSDKDSKLPFKLSIELWSLESTEPLSVIDWGTQSFRQGQPSLSSLRCNAQGYIFANLFWGLRPWTIGVGLLIIEPKAERAIVWERRQGYDGELALSKTPLLPHSAFNEIEFSGDRLSYIATNSGLAIVDFKATQKADQLKILDEAHGWPTEFINDIFVASTHGQKDSGSEEETRIWLATPRGLLRLIGDQQILKIKGDATSLGSRLSDGTLWVAFKDQLWISPTAGEGEANDWIKVKMNTQLKVGSIRHIFPRTEGGAWIVDDHGVYFTKDRIH